MTQPTDSSNTSRRTFLKTSGSIAAAAAVMPTAYAGENNTIRLALIGCGGRGSGAASNAMSAPGGPVELYAMADVNSGKLNMSHKALTRRYKDKVNVSDDRRFLGFDAYKKAIDCLRPGDVALLTAYSYCRAQHMDYAIDKGVNVFMEKPFVPDPGSGHRMLAAGKRADAKGLKVGAGLMCRHSVARQSLIQKIRDGELGEIMHVRAYRMWGGGGLRKRPDNENELMWQIRNRMHFHWAGSGAMIEMLIHQIDECCWIKGMWPVSCHGLGGRVPNSTDHGQGIDTYAMEFTFPDGTLATVDSRSMRGSYNDFTTYLHGTKHAAQFSGHVHRPTTRIFKDQRLDPKQIIWSAGKEPYGPHQAEWNVLMDSIRNNKPHNETQRAVYADFAAIMGRAACHINNIVTWDQVFNSKFLFCDYVDTLAADSPAPVKADKDGRYAAPIPGQWKEL